MLLPDMRVVRLCQIALLGLVFVPFSADAWGRGLVPRATHKAQAQWSVPATLRWNLVARALVRKNLVDPLWAARTYTIVSVAQYDAVRSASQLSAGTSDQVTLIEAA